MTDHDVTDNNYFDHNTISFKQIQNLKINSVLK